MKAKVLYFMVGIVICLGMNSCLEKEEFPDEPIIKYVSSEINGSEMELVFSFTDGDGNFGLDEGDTVAPFNVDPFQKNLIVDYFEKQNGEWKRFGSDFNPASPFYIPGTFNQSVPWVQPTGQRKVQQGEVTYTITGIFGSTSDFDTCRFDFFIYDRSLNASNSESTPIFLKP